MSERSGVYSDTTLRTLLGLEPGDSLEGGGGSDLPAYDQEDAGKVLTVDSEGTGLEWATPETELPTTTLSDAGKVLTVNSAGTGYELDTPSGGDLPVPVEGDAGKVVTVNGADDGYELYEIPEPIVPGVCTISMDDAAYTIDYLPTEMESNPNVNGVIIVFNGYSTVGRLETTLYNMAEGGNEFVTFFYYDSNSLVSPLHVLLCEIDAATSVVTVTDKIVTVS